MGEGIFVVKANGEKEPFSEEKVRLSIQKSGIPKELEDQAVIEVKSILYKDIPTQEIYKKITDFLKTNYPIGSGRYNLKHAIMELGPTGYPFEKFIAELLKEYGYNTETNLILSGKCVSHEIDVLAKKGDRVYFVECKYHNQYGARSDIQVALYVKARLDDLKDSGNRQSKNLQENAWIFTNTKFSQEAIVYAECQQIRLTGWSYPKKGNLQQMIEEKNLYPLTCLSSLSTEQKKTLISNNIILARDVFENEFAADLLRLEADRKQLLFKEAELFKSVPQ